MTRLDRLGSNLMNGGVIGTRDDEIRNIAYALESTAFSPPSADAGATWGASIDITVTEAQTSLSVLIHVFNNSGSGTVTVSTVDSDGWSQSGSWTNLGGSQGKQGTFTLASGSGSYSIQFNVTSTGGGITDVVLYASVLSSAEVASGTNYSSVTEIVAA